MCLLLKENSSSLTRGAEQQSAEVISHPSANLVSHAGANDKFRAACHALAVAGMLTGPIPINRMPRQRPSLAALTHRIALFKASPLSVFAVKTRGSHTTTTSLLARSSSLSSRAPSSLTPSSVAGCLHPCRKSQPRAMEVGASMAMQSRAPRVGAGAAGGRRSAFLGREKQARVGSLRVGAGSAGAAAVAVRARGTNPVAPLRCVRASRGEL